MAGRLTLLVLLSAIWSSSFVFIKIGVETVPPTTLAAARIVLAATILAAVMATRRQPWPRGRGPWALLVGVAVFGNALPFTLIAWGEQRIDSGLAAILMAVMPLATLVLAHLATADERLTVPRVAGVAIGFAGVMALVGREALGGVGTAAAHQAAVAGAAICYALAATLARRLPPLTSLARATAALACAGAVMIPAAILVDRPWSLAPSAGSVASIAYLGLVPTAVGTLIYFRLLSAAGATFVSFTNYLLPVMGVTWGALVLGERLTTEMLLAMVAILAGIAIAGSLPGRPPQS